MNKIEDLLIYLGAIWFQDFATDSITIKFTRHQPTDDEAEMIQNYYRKKCKNVRNIVLERRL